MGGVGGVCACNSEKSLKILEQERGKIKASFKKTRLGHAVEESEEQMTMGRGVRTPGSSYEGLRSQRQTGPERRKC